MDISQDTLLELYRRVVRIREFETTATDQAVDGGRIAQDQDMRRPELRAPNQPVFMSAGLATTHWVGLAGDG